MIHEKKSSHGFDFTDTYSEFEPFRCNKQATQLLIEYILTII